jgi:hypothetical protein
MHKYMDGSLGAHETVSGRTGGKRREGGEGGRRGGREGGPHYSYSFFSFFSGEPSLFVDLRTGGDPAGGRAEERSEGN